MGLKPMLPDGPGGWARAGEAGVSQAQLEVQSVLLADVKEKMEVVVLLA